MGGTPTKLTKFPTKRGGDSLFPTSFRGNKLFVAQSTCLLQLAVEDSKVVRLPEILETLAPDVDKPNEAPRMVAGARSTRLLLHMAMIQLQWYQFGIGAPLILIYFSGDWDVHWGYCIYGLLTHGYIAFEKTF